MSLVSSATIPEVNASQLLVVELGGALYGIPGSAVQEIVATAPATRLPGAPAYVRGIMNLRGQLVTVVDLAQRVIGHPSRNADAPTIVVQSGARTLGLTVDDVRDVQSMDAAAEEELPYRPETTTLGRRLGRFGTDVVIVLDIEQLTQETFG